MSTVNNIQKFPKNNFLVNEVDTGGRINFPSDLTNLKLKNMVDAICRIVIANGKGYATGFLISEGLIMTNNHALSNSEQCKQSHVEFFYEDGKVLHRLELDADRFFYTSNDPKNGILCEEYLDFTIVALKGRIDVIKRVETISIFEDIAPKPGEKANIIQHPNGGYKKVTFYDNVVQKVVNAFEVHYSATTDFGSSGSPVLNDSGQLYALHKGGCEIEKYNRGILMQAIVKNLSDYNVIDSVRNWKFIKYDPMIDFSLIQSLFSQLIRQIFCNNNNK